MNILVVNDDGYQAEGLAILVRALAPFGNVYVSAPKDHQSAKSHAITIRSRIETFIQFWARTSGSPADARLKCLILILFVVSGIN